MPEIYRDLITFLNESTFTCYVYGGFVERIPLYFQKYPERKPLFQNEQGFSTTKLTIIQMVDNYVKGIPFTVVEADEVVFILRLCRKYIEDVGSVTERLVADKSDDAHVFLRNIRAFVLELSTNEGKITKAYREKNNLPEAIVSKVRNVLERLSKGELKL